MKIINKTDSQHCAGVNIAGEQIDYTINPFEVIEVPDKHGEILAMYEGLEKVGEEQPVETEQEQPEEVTKEPEVEVQEEEVKTEEVETPSEEVNTVYTCHHCSEQFESKDGYVEHLKVHEAQL